MTQATNRAAHSSMDEGGGVWLTPHQKKVDLTVVSLLEHPAVVAARNEAEARFRAAPEFSVADAPATLRAAVDNLLFSCLQIATNRDPSRPGVIWTVRMPYRVGGQSIPDSHHGGDNPDRVYRLAGVSPEYRYEVRGRRHPTHPSSGELYFEAVRPPGLYGQPLLGLQAHNIDVAADGTFSFIADSTPTAGRRNHLHLPPSAENIVIRDTLKDWGKEIANDVEIRVIDGPSRPERTFDQLAQDGSALFAQCVDTHLGFVQFCLQEQPENQLLAFERPVHWGMGGGIYAINRFELADDEALLITLDMLGAHSFNIGSYDPWATAVDYSTYVSCFNNIQAQPDRDGRYTFVVSPRDPGVHNWIETGGLHTGAVIARWDARAAVPLSNVGTDPDYGSTRAFAPEKRVEAAVPVCRRLEVAKASAAVPAGQDRVTPEQRKKLQATRRAEHRVRVTSRPL